MTAVYQKLRGVELPVTRELVRRTAGKKAQVLDSVGWCEETLIPGYETRVLDGFHLRGTEHRIKETRSLRATPLPGQCLAVLDPQRHLLVDIYAELSAEHMAEALKNHARHVRQRRYLKHRRGSKKPPPKRTGRKSHVSTAQVLATRRRRE